MKNQPRSPAWPWLPAKSPQEIREGGSLWNRPPHLHCYSSANSVYFFMRILMRFLERMSLCAASMLLSALFLAGCGGAPSFVSSHGVQVFLADPQGWKTPKPHPHADAKVPTCLTTYRGQCCSLVLTSAISRLRASLTTGYFGRISANDLKSTVGGTPTTQDLRRDFLV